MGAENLAPTGIRSPDHLYCSKSPYRLSHPSPQRKYMTAQKCFSFLKHTKKNSLWDPNNLLFNRYWGSILGVKRSGRGGDHSSPSNAKVKNEWSHTSTPARCHHGVDRNCYIFLVKINISPAQPKCFIPSGLV